MASLIAKATGNFTAAGSWGVAEAATGAIQTTRSSATNTTTSYVYSSTFTVTNLDVIEGVLIHLKRLTSTGTFSVSLSEDNGTTATREVTVNASDMPADQAWVFFKFGSTLTGDGGTDYRVGIKGSSAANVTVYRDGTAGNWARLLRTSATGAPAAADIMYIAGEWTVAGTVAALTVTMNETATTDYGALDIGNNGTLTYGTSASTAYLLKMSGDLNVWDGGTLNMGTTGTPMPSTSSGSLNFDCGSNVQYGLLLNNGSTCVMQGASKTVSALLAADAAANATSLTTNVSTSWADNDEIAVASTTRTASQTEKGTLNGAASGTSLTVDGFGGAGGGLANAHSGTSPTQAEIINLTRNVKVFGASASLQAYILVGNTAVVDWDYVEFHWLGSSTTNKRGIDVTTTTGSFNAQYCSLHDLEAAQSQCFTVTGSAANNFTISNNVSFDSERSFLTVAATSGTSWAVSGNIAMRSLSTALFDFSDLGGTITNNTAAGSDQQGFVLNDSASTMGTFSGNVAHSNTSFGVSISALPEPATLSSITAWRNNNYGLRWAATTWRTTIDTAVLFGNATGNINGGVTLGFLTLKSVTANGDTTFSSGIGFATGNTLFYPGLRMENCNFGTASGIKTTHSTADIDIGSSNNHVEITGSNVTLASSTQVNAIDTNARHGSFIGFDRFGHANGTYKAWRARAGIITSDTAISRTASPSERLAPVSASVKLASGSKRKAVASGGTWTVSVYVRKSEAGDGAAYNGNQPRLILKANPAAGINSDVVLDTATAASDGAWEELTGTSAGVSDDVVLEAYIDCDGTAGWVNVDDWDSHGQKYWFNGVPNVGIVESSGAVTMVHTHNTVITAPYRVTSYR